MSFFAALGGLSLLLACGFALRLAVPLLGRLMLPVSLVGGFIGLAAGPFGVNIVPAPVMSVWTTLPAILINIVFACLFLGAPVPSVRSVAGSAGPLIRFSLVNAVGQFVVGLLLTWAVLTPVFGVPALFGCLIEVGFSGGQGSASAMASVYANLGFPAGGPLGQASATIGIISGVIGGIVLIQWGARRGYVRELGEQGLCLENVSGFIAPDARRPIAIGTVNSSTIEPFTLHVAVAMLAVLVGWVLQTALARVHPALASVPLFPLAMIGGMLLQMIADRTGTSVWLDRGTFQRLTGLSLDLLVAAAIASMRVDLFLQNVAPFTILMIAAVAWCMGTFVWLAPRMLTEDWFEQAIVVYGTLTGVSAVGLMLLRIADPHQRTTAAQAFAARSMVTAPLLGGGIVTATMPLMIVNVGVLPMLAATTLVMVAAWAWPMMFPTRRAKAA
ncbi:MAG: hypothetical protein U0Q11_14390 [Vicinamibacterales bacterium]